MAITLSKSGRDTIKSMEGFRDKQPDGTCTTYRCIAGKLTIGWGCTEGVTEGMRETVPQLEERLTRELIKHEAAVRKAVTWPQMTHSQFDALVSFSFNAGTGALASSSMVKRLNAGDVDGAANAFMLWTKYTDPDTGKKKTSRGLVNRRAREREIFTRDDAPAEMPQAVATPADIPQGSRQMAWFERAKLFLGIGTGGVVTVQQLHDTMGPTTAVIGPVVKFAASNGVVLAVGAGVAGYLLIASIQAQLVRTYRDGRYQPSADQT
jgi:lysozyme